MDSWIWIVDVSAFDAKSPALDVSVDEKTTVSELLDTVYFAISDRDDAVLAR